MWLDRGTPALIAVLLTAVLLAGCAGSLGSRGSPVGSSGSSSVSSNSLGSSEQMASAGTAPKPETGPRGVAQVADAPSSAATAGGYRIGPADVLDISVFNVPELSKTVQVADTGTVNFPLVGEVPAAGKTAQQLERELTAKLGAKYLQNPQVTVLLKENNSQLVTIEGAVKSPGVYPMKGETTLLQSMAHGRGNRYGYFQFNRTCLEKQRRQTFGREVRRRRYSEGKCGRSPAPVRGCPRGRDLCNQSWIQ